MLSLTRMLTPILTTLLRLPLPSGCINMPVGVKEQENTMPIMKGRLRSFFKILHVVQCHDQS